MSDGLVSRREPAQDSGPDGRRPIAAGRTRHSRGTAAIGWTGRTDWIRECMARVGTSGYPRGPWATAARSSVSEFVGRQEVVLLAGARWRARPELFLEREGSGTQWHFSLHESGQWHLKEGGQERVTWVRPGELVPGFTRASPSCNRLPWRTGMMLPRRVWNSSGALTRSRPRSASSWSGRERT